jgi:hypothetical protein
MFKLESIVVANGTTHCKLKQDSKVALFNSDTLIGFIKDFCTVMRNKELHLLNSRRKNSLSICFFFVFYIILIIQYVA